MWHHLTACPTAAITRVTSENHGQTLVEYAFVITLIAIFLIAGLGFLAGDLAGAFGAIGDALAP